MGVEGGNKLIHLVGLELGCPGWKTKRYGCTECRFQIESSKDGIVISAVEENLLALLNV